MDPFLVLFLGIYVWVSLKVVRLFPARSGKVIAILILILIPTADAIYGRIKLKQMCEAEGGIKIFRTVEVRGFRYLSLRPQEDWITKDHYQFVEGEGSDGRPARVSRQPDGTIITEKAVTPISEYAYEMEDGELSRGYGYVEYRVINIQTNEKLAVFKKFSYEGGWVERATARLYGSKGIAASCGYSSIVNITMKLIKDTLQPAQD